MRKIIHTAEIKYTIPATEISLLLTDLDQTIPEFALHIRQLLASKTLKNAYVSQMPENLNRGIVALNLYKSKMYRTDKLLYLIITLDLEALCQNNKTVELFYCSINNVIYLQNAYAAAITAIFPSAKTAELYFDGEEYKAFGIACLPYLGLAKVNRIDYAMNLQAECPDLYLYMAGKSFTSSHKKLMKLNKDNNNVYAGSQRKKFSLYDKQDRFLQLDEEILASEAENIIRYEAPVIKPTLSWLRNFSSADKIIGLLTFLDENIASGHLLSEYFSNIGFGNWYTDYYYTKIINNSCLNQLQKKKMLKEFAPLLSQTRSIEEAKKQYISGNYKIAKTQKIVSGTAQTFSKYMKLYQQIDLQPLRIPDRKAAEYGVTSIINPIKNTADNHNEYDPSAVIIEDILNYNYVNNHLFSQQFSNTDVA